MSKFKETILYPKNWFLDGKEKQKFIAKRTFYGENLERALADIDYAAGSNELKKAHAEIDKKYNRITDEQYERTLIDLDSLSDLDKVLEKLKLDLKYNKITQDDYEKEKATAMGEPYVKVVKVHIDSKKPSDGSFELDWNDKFVEQLVEAGYVAPAQELVVKLWFDEVCANVARENGAVFPNEIEEFKHKSARKVKSETGKVELT